MSKRSLMMVITFVAVLSLALAACGGDDDDDDATNTPADAGAATEVATEAEEMEGDAAAGEAVFQANCAVCHTTDGSALVGPTWQGIWMSEEELADGTIVVVDEEYVIESIRTPNAKIVAGFDADVMTPFDASQISDEDITNLIAYMQSLQ